MTGVLNQGFLHSLGWGRDEGGGGLRDIKGSIERVS